MQGKHQTKYAHDKVVLAKYLQKPAKNDVEKPDSFLHGLQLTFNMMMKHLIPEKKKMKALKVFLARRTSLSNGFTTLFLELGQQMNLQVQKIRVMQKDPDFKRVRSFRQLIIPGTLSNCRSWQLIDVTWGGSFGEVTDKGLKKRKEI